MNTYKLIHAAAFLTGIMLTVFTSCIREDLPLCPPDKPDEPELADYTLYQTYTHHTGKEGADLFTVQARRSDVFIFDENHRYVARQTDSVPVQQTLFGQTFRLPAGKYTLVSWANLTDQVNLTALTPGVSTLEEAKLILKAKTKALSNDKLNYSDNALQPLFFGQKEAVIEPGKSRTDTLPVIKNTNRIRVVIHWRDKDGKPCNYSCNRGITVQISGTDGAYHFDNSPATSPDEWLHYMPFQSAPVDSTGLATDFSMMRLIKERDQQLVIRRPDSSRVLYKATLLADNILHHPLINTQDDLDRQDEYLIELFLRCDLSKPVPDPDPDPTPDPDPDPDPDPTPDPDPEPDPDPDPSPPVTNNTYIQTYITINGWTIKLTDSEIGM